MSAWNEGVYTQKGLALLAKLTQGTNLQITRAVVGSGLVDESSLPHLLSVKDIKNELVFQRATYPENGVCKLPLYLANDNVPNTYTIRQIGLYAFDPDEGEILYFIAQSENGTEVPSASIAPGFTASWTFYFRYGQADTVNITVDPNNAVTADMLQDIYDQLANGMSVKDNGSVAVGKGSSNLQFVKFSVYGKSVQNGVPTPASPQAILNISDKDSNAVGDQDGYMTTLIWGKNLFPVQTFETQNGVTITRFDDYFVLNGTCTGSYNFITAITFLPKGNHMYTLSAGNPVNNNLGLSIVDIHNGKTGETLPVFDNANYGVARGTLQGGSGYVTRIRIENGVTYNNYIIKPQLELGGNATEYEPWHTAQSAFMQLGDIGMDLRGVPVQTGGNYTDESGQQWICDEIDLVKGVFIQRIKSVDLSTVTFTPSTYWHQCTIADMLYVDSNLQIGAAMAYNYKIRQASGMTASEFGEFAIDVNTIKINTGSTTTQPSGELIYALATPIEIPLPTDVLEDIKTFHSYNDTTVAFTTKGAEIEMECISSAFENSVRMILENATGGVDASELNFLPTDGGEMTGAIGMGSNKITDLAAPTNDNDAVNKKYADDTFVKKTDSNTGGAATADFDMGSHAIINVKDPTNNSDAATKGYVDNKFLDKTTGGTVNGALIKQGNGINAAYQVKNSYSGREGRFQVSDDSIVQLYNILSTGTFTRLDFVHSFDHIKDAILSVVSYNPYTSATQTHIVPLADIPMMFSINSSGGLRISYDDGN